MRLSLSANKSIKKNLWLYFLPTIIFLGGCLLHYWRGYYSVWLPNTQAEGTDDAYISYRYGWNLTHFGTLSWNESGYRRTEGFTNPLWVALSAVAALPGHKEWVYPMMTGFSIILSIFLLAGLIWVVHQRFHHPLATTGILLACAAPIVWLNATSGLESTVFAITMALLTCLVFYNQNGKGVQVVIILLSLVIGWLRSDGFIYLCILLVAAWISGSNNWKPVLVGLIISTGLLLLWHQLSFGAWVPNTSVAKLSHTFLTRFQAGWLILIIIMLISPVMILFPMLGVLGLGLQSRRIALAGIFIFLAWIGYFLFMGGDSYFERHLIGLLFLSAAFSAPLWSIPRTWLRSLLILIISIGTFATILRGQGRFNYKFTKPNDPLVLLGQAVGENRDYYGVMISRPAGKIPFFAGGDCIDPYGLNDPELALIQRERFFPGHSSGDDRAALQIAQKHPRGVYSLFTTLDSGIISDPKQISFWVNNQHPQEVAQGTPTMQQWQTAMASEDLSIWSIITQPFPASFSP